MKWKIYFENVLFFCLGFQVLLWCFVIFIHWQLVWKALLSQP